MACEMRLLKRKRQGLSFVVGCVRGLVMSACVGLLLVSRVWALEPDEILLVVNRNVPESGKLAEFYRAARLIPMGRMVSLNLPRMEEMGFGVYEREVVFPIRQFLRKNELRNKVKCIVTFYGVPLRLGVRTVTAEERAEAAELQTEQVRVLEQVRKAVVALEGEAGRFDKQFKAGQGEDLGAIGGRAQAAWDLLSRQVAGLRDQEGRGQGLKAIVESVRQLHGRAGLIRMIGGGDDAAAPGERAGVTLKDLRKEIGAAAAELTGMQDRLFEAEARGRMRKLVAESFGSLELSRVLQVQLEHLAPGTTVTALDSELALLWWDSHGRKEWQVNPLHYQLEQAASGPRVMMVMRLDAPQSGQVRDIILSSLKAERDGLKGKVVLDSRGLRSRPENIKFGSYVWYDEGIRNLAELIRTKTKLSLLHDESPGVLPADSATDVALYCGWYSVRNYVPSCRLNGGAIGFHVASFELVSLKNPTEKGWCAGLLNDGAAATLGPVAEPYLSAFPAADDFFPLLMTGKLSLAEVYWRTATTTGWMMTVIGDPLYRPYKANPALRVEDVPARVRGVLTGGSTRPSTGRAQ